ncbi:DUF560 domain-containing protein [Altererythrobacter aurantiacus]|uniref:DUF560 domain-containing protein n=1 Tax=Parapontixanthobacter aurantiacus TaxID=1463599 RepID=A0A844ZEJ0_9SPHN|nr:surface lipoprotein assembly modifier [Parapontixanthobacter aurantiacus]MXO85566.1 DUF560 domain-containing protein [Parapontixanthobacter aurantiacus]
MSSNVVRLAAAVLVAVAPFPVLAQSNGQPVATRELTPAQLFAFADAARDAGNYELAETAYRALATNPDVALRNEARFRLAMMLAYSQSRPRDAEVLLRQILDEQPETARVRLELGRVLADLGEVRAAERELRAAQAAGLPPEVERLVRFFTGRLNQAKPFGVNFQLAFAPDTNINRATQSDTLETIIGDFDLSEDARAQSGIGLSSRLRAFARIPTDEHATLALGFNGSGRFYRESAFNDIIVGGQIGSEIRSGTDYIEVSGVANWRWFGGILYTKSYGVTGRMRHPLNPRTQLNLDAALIYSDDQLNDLRDAEVATASVGLDRSLDARTGIGGSVSASRNFANDEGYATASGDIDFYAYREFGSTTALVRAGYSHLEADRRLFLYPERRKDDRFTTSIAGTFRSFRVGTFAPQVQLS